MTILLELVLVGAVGAILWYLRKYLFALDQSAERTYKWEYAMNQLLSEKLAKAKVKEPEEETPKKTPNDALHDELRKKTNI